MMARAEITPPGFRLTFSNGWAASVAWRLPMNYGDGETTVELAAVRDEHVVGDVRGWAPIDEIPAFLADVAGRCHCGSDLAGSDHCPYCGCEQHERTCERVNPRAFDLYPQTED